MYSIIYMTFAQYCPIYMILMYMQNTFQSSRLQNYRFRVSFPMDVSGVIFIVGYNDFGQVRWALANGGHCSGPRTMLLFVLCLTWITRSNVPFREMILKYKCTYIATFWHQNRVLVHSLPLCPSFLSISLPLSWCSLYSLEHGIWAAIYTFQKKHDVTPVGTNTIKMLSVCP